MYCGTVFELSPPVAPATQWTHKVLLYFTGGIFGGAPVAGLIADSAGNMYGTTEYGGACAANKYGCGVVFKLSPPVPPATQWSETVLHAFTFTGSSSDGSSPVAGLIADSAGNLYGTTPFGGSSQCRNKGCGVVFELSPQIPPATKWTETLLYRFADGSDGGEPAAGLIADSNGNLYGTTEQGGDLSGCGGSGCGVVFKLSPPVPPATRWTETVLRAFTGGSDGDSPRAGLIFDSKANLYGTTFGGGAANLGVVFELSPNRVETILHSFLGGSDGAKPQAGLYADSKGRLYGTTLMGGVCAVNEASGCGVVFRLRPPTRLSPQWAETVLHTFTAHKDGADPMAGLIADSAGNLYGTAYAGGVQRSGVVFELAP